MTKEEIIALVCIIFIVVAVVIFCVYAKKKGRRCIGCPENSACRQCSANCQSCQSCDSCNSFDDDAETEGYDEME